MSGLRALEKAEGQALHVAEHGVAQVARDVLLQRRPELSGDPREQVLHGDERQDGDDDRLERTHPVVGVEEPAHELALEARQPALGGRGDGRQFLSCCFIHELIAVIGRCVQEIAGTAAPCASVARVNRRKQIRQPATPVTSESAPTKTCAVATSAALFDQIVHAATVTSCQ